MLHKTFPSFCFLIFTLAVMPGAVSAQKSMECPRFKKEKKYNESDVIYYLQPNAFFTYPFAYKYAQPFDKTYFKPASRMGFAINVQNYLVLSNRVEVLGEVMYAMNEHGLKYKFQDEGITFADKYFTMSAQYRFSLGLAYNVNEKLNVAIAPSIVYNTLTGYASSGSSTSTANGTVVANVNWGDTGFPELWYVGANIYARWNVWKRMYLNFMTAVDFAPSARQTAELSIFENGIYRDHRVEKYPYLFHVGVGVGFRGVEIKRGG